MTCSECRQAYEAERDGIQYIYCPYAKEYMAMAEAKHLTFVDCPMKEDEYQDTAELMKALKEKYRK